MNVIITKKPFRGLPVGAQIELSTSQARVLTKIGRAQYLTRDMAVPVYQTRMMQAEPAPVFAPEVAPVSASVPEAAESTESAESAESQAIVETDSDGAEWDAAMHVATKLKNADGTWRKKPGAKAAL